MEILGYSEVGTSQSPQSLAPNGTARLGRVTRTATVKLTVAPNGTMTHEFWGSLVSSFNVVQEKGRTDASWVPSSMSMRLVGWTEATGPADGGAAALTMTFGSFKRVIISSGTGGTTTGTGGTTTGTGGTTTGTGGTTTGTGGTTTGTGGTTTGTGGTTTGTGGTTTGTGGTTTGTGGTTTGTVSITGFAKIPAGTYQRGNVVGDSDITDAPAQVVTLSAYKIAINNTTKAQWDAVRTWALTRGYADLPAGVGKAPNHPVVNVNWFDVIKWVNAASEKEGLVPCYKVGGSVIRTGTSSSVTCDWMVNGYRLPTEAEWEIAARGGLSGKRFPWGDTISRGNANYSGNTSYSYDLGPVGQHPTYSQGEMPHTSPVGSFAANGYGLHDMAGNVFQWCWDWAGPYAAGTNPRGIANGVNRIRRGGHCYEGPDVARCAYRAYVTPDFDNRTIGFRLAQTDTGGTTTETGGTTTGTAGTGFAKIPGGTYQMGNLNGDSDNTDVTNADPVSVTLSPYYMAIHHTTKAQWDTVRTWASSKGYTDLAVGAGKAANHPVQTVSWYDVVKWANAASEKDGLAPCYKVSGAVYRIGNNDSVSCDWTMNGYRLPTEAEWEVAARGGLSGKRFPWGDTISHSQANYVATTYTYDLSSSVNDCHPTYKTGEWPYTSPVGSFAANGYGLFDMAGNAYQWCWDWFGMSYAGGNDPRGADGAAPDRVRVMRGGGWRNAAIYLRSAGRIYNFPSDASNSVGFRLVRGRL